MCGFAGIFHGTAIDREHLQSVLPKMLSALVHRGPDDAGVWVDGSCSIGLGHRRLAILDLSPSGHQPMVSACGRYVVVFNGELYNHLEIRQELERGASSGGAAGSGEWCWRGHSDTETLLAAAAVWGVEGMLGRVVGMFAIALWDRTERTLYLARDRMGEKPLYYGLQGHSLLFASELGAFQAYPDFRGEVSQQALTLLLRHNAIPGPHSIYRGVFKLPPGTLLKISQDDVFNARLPLPSAYWSLKARALEGQRNPFSGSETEASEELERLLQQSIAGQMIADVPLGAFLSGGIDSSTVVALMQAQSNAAVQTFTIGFHESGYNEAKHAHAVAAYLGTKHTELYVTSAQAMAVVSRLHEIYDEPFADVSQIPTFLVSELARQHVTVCLSGDGGDELFGGYNRYVWAAAIWRRLHWLPNGLRTALAGVITSISPSSWNDVFCWLGVFLPDSWRYANPGDKLHKLADVLAVRSPDEIYDCLISHWKRPEEVIGGRVETATVLGGKMTDLCLPDLEHRMMYLDSICYLPDDILVKVDRAAMGVSLETRVPFLDHRIVEFSWRLPLEMKIRNRQGKQPVRQVLDRYVPKRLIERPKMGFGVPLDAWLRGPLKDWGDKLLTPSRLKREGFFNPDPIWNMWLEHLDGGRNWSHQLWGVLMFQSWLSRE